MDKQPSEIIKDFLELLDESHELYLNSKSQVDGFNRKTYEWTHDLEDCKNKSERNKLATAWQKELKERRKQKDIMKLYEGIHNFASDNNNKAFIKRIRHLLQEQIKTEEHLAVIPEEREYKGAGRR